MTDSKYLIQNGNYIFKNKKKENIVYEIYNNKISKGGVCGCDKHCNYHQASRIFSELGYSPTLTASNTSDNAKVLVESEVY